ncbi:hypothetical protein CONPUDRAFT_73221 [Coniophora puteana RWD-64-598 SS2]|uniref:Uncharacterized protein n=1 Tax=Coniophora puteana (strain RWD-64-598) TaxID=741705 RepID=A0A5M3MSK4_CONPW|nr:uncharacterized protein CONPUDRAFT_73221 [Coniophora puteana RWD-64-598 SS2]EIW81511.1 hypothetical protein CONPUDRAFT_73221 [Coniophora puteana RWD-64-598 SS2]
MFLFTKTAAQPSVAGSSAAIDALHDFKTIQYASSMIYHSNFLPAFVGLRKYFTVALVTLYAWDFGAKAFVPFYIIAWLAGENKFVVIPVTTLFIVSSGMYMGGDIAQLFIGQVLEPEYGLCQIKEITTLSFLSCVPIMTTDLVLVIIIGWKTIKYHLEIMDSSWSGASLLKTLARGAFLFYLGTFMTTLLALFLFFTHPGIVGIAGGSLFTLVPMAVNHLVLGLRETVMDQAYGDPALVATVSMQFGV